MIQYYLVNYSVLLQCSKTIGLIFTSNFDRC